MKLSQKTLVVLLVCTLELVLGANLSDQTETLPVEVEQDLPTVSPTVALAYGKREIRLKRLLAKPNQLEILWPHDLVIIRQMADWEFAYFKTALEHLVKDTLYITLNKENFSYKNFGLICEMMEETKNEWTTIELIDLLIIGEQFLASGEAKEKIIFIVAMEIFEERLDAEIVAIFPLFEVEILEALYALRHPAISIENENQIFQLDGEKIPEVEKELVTKYFVLRAKKYNNAQIMNYKFTKKISELIGEQLKYESIVYYTYETATICSGKDFQMFYEKISYLRSLDFTVVKSKSTSSLIEAIEARERYDLEIFNSEFNVLSLDLNEVLTKISICDEMKISGDFNAECFGEFYFRMKDAVSKKEIDPNSRARGHLLFFSCLESQAHHKRLFGWRFEKIRKCKESFTLCLLKTYKRIAEYELIDFSTKTFSFLIVVINDNEYLHLLNNVFNNDKIHAIQFNLYSPFNQFDKLAEILSHQTVLSFTLEDIDLRVENAQNLIASLSQTNFWNGLENLHFSKVSLQTLLEGLRNLPQYLKRLKITLRQSSNGQIGKIVTNLKGKEFKNLFVEELIIKCRSENDCTDDLEQLPLLFPNLRKLIIDDENNHFKHFKIRNNKLEEFKIICKWLDNEDDFIRELMNSKSLKSVHVDIYRRVIEWKKDGRIYAEFKAISDIQNYYRKMRYH